MRFLNGFGQLFLRDFRLVWDFSSLSIGGTALSEVQLCLCDAGFYLALGVGMMPGHFHHQ